MSDALNIYRPNDLSDESIVRLNGVQPTEEAYSDILLAFAWFNDRLFEGQLSAPMITFARKPRMLGAFCPRRFESKSGIIAHEIILNPHYLSQREDFESLSTLVHEMAHQWREDFGPESARGRTRRNGYHDEAWAACMERLGLMPSSTGEPGGKRTGSRVSHFIVEGGRFDRAARGLIARGFVIRWHERIAPAASKGRTHEPGLEPETSQAAKGRRSKDRLKFTCPDCGLNAWAKPSAQLKCCPCNQILKSQNL